MTRDEIASMIGAAGLPYAYDHFDPKDKDRPEAPPYICFLYSGRDDFAADNINYVRIVELSIELYTDNVRFDLEERIEAAITAAGLTYDRGGNEWLEDERMYITTYTTEVMLDA